MLTLSILLWLHIFSAVGWLGAAMVFAMLIGPTIGTLTPGARAEIVTKLFPKYVRYAEAFSLMTVIFGDALVLDLGNGDMSIFSMSGVYRLISVGAVLALLAVILAFTVVTPSARKVHRLTVEMVKNSTTPPPELMKASVRLRVSSSVGLVLLILVLVFMVAGTTGVTG